MRHYWPSMLLMLMVILFFGAAQWVTDWGTHDFTLGYALVHTGCGLFLLLLPVFCFDMDREIQAKSHQGQNVR